jgi:hypothetical protein
MASGSAGTAPSGQPTPVATAACRRRGTTRTLTFGLEHDPIGAVEQAVGFVEATAQAHGIEHPIQMTLGISDGERLCYIQATRASPT